MKTINIGRLFKGIIMILLGFIIPIKALVDPDDTWYRCTIRGVKSSYGIEPWGVIWEGFGTYIKGGN